jgi:hypothetical protein
MDALTTALQQGTAPEGLSLVEWNAACLRVEDYLRAHQLGNRAVVLRLTLEILQRAVAQRAQRPEEPFLGLALDEATRWADEWFAKLSGERTDDLQDAARGRVAWVATHLGRGQGETFAPVTPALSDVVGRISLQAGPNLEFTSLSRAEIDYGTMKEIARESRDQFSWVYVLRAFVIWVGVFLLCYGLYWHFYQ